MLDKQPQRLQGAHARTQASNRGQPQHRQRTYAHDNTGWQCTNANTKSKAKPLKDAQWQPGAGLGTTRASSGYCVPTHLQFAGACSDMPASNIQLGGQWHSR